MKALKFNGTWRVDKLDKMPDLDCIGTNDVVVNVNVCGICGTDIGIITGAYPVAVKGTTLGHEAAGVVAKIGSGVTKVKVGDRVVINPTYSCGVCRMCMIGNPNHCEKKFGTEAGVSYDGAFAEQYRTQEEYLIKLNDSVSMEAAALTEPLSCVITGVDKLGIKNTNIRAAVVGAGPMGILYLWVLHINGVNAFLVEKNKSRQEFAKYALPPHVEIYDDFKNAMHTKYGNEKQEIDLCVDTTGYITQDVFSNLAPGGKLLNVALKNTFANLSVLKFADKSISVIGSIDSLDGSFERAYAMIRDGKIPASKLISQVYNFEDYKEAFLTVGCDIDGKKQTEFKKPSCKVLLRIGKE